MQKPSQPFLSLAFMSFLPPLAEYSRVLNLALFAAQLRMAFGSMAKMTWLRSRCAVFQSTGLGVAPSPVG